MPREPHRYRDQLDVYDVLDDITEEIRQTSGMCAMTGKQHDPVWFRSAWWCSQCRQKIVPCCEGQPQGDA